MATITLEMVDEVIQRTGASYKEAKDALEFCHGDLLDAVVYIETAREYGRDFKREFSDKSNEVIEKAKNLIKKGNVTRCLVEKDDRILLDIPVNAGGIAAIFAVQPTIIAITAALAMGCQLKIIKDNGEEIHLNEKMNRSMDAVKDQVENIKSKVARGDKNKEACEGCDEVEPFDPEVFPEEELGVGYYDRGLEGEGDSRRTEE